MRLDGLDNPELIVAALDSGSDKSLDIVGIAGAISKLSDLFLQAFDKGFISSSF